MSYVVLARKYRPKNFAEMVGQEHVVQALGNALRTQRLHHAYLFTGTRGVGKTTVSRILAKSLNCTGIDGQGGITAEPCGVCDACRDIDAGRFVDYTELDAASNRGVDEVQSLLEQAVYKPVQGRFKVFMIDEVHMLTNTAFNAMLKTLEEPPEYLKFVLATTDPQKVPVTVLSRCLQFNLRPMAPETVQEHLLRVLNTEGVGSDPGALRQLARAARGSMRDALSLTDQAIAFGGGRLQETTVRQMLGAVDRHHVWTLLEALADGDGARVVDTVDDLRVNGFSAVSVLDELVGMLQRMAVFQQVPSAAASADDADDQRLAALAEAMPADEAHLLYSLALHGRSELGLAPDEYAALNMVLLRHLVFRSPVAEKKTLKRAPAPSQAVEPAVIAPLPAVVAVEAPAEAPVRASLAAPVLEAVPAPTPEPEPEPETEPEPEPETFWDDPSAPAIGDVLESVAEDEPVAAESVPSALPPTASSMDPSLGDFWFDQVQALIRAEAVTALVRELALQSCLVQRTAAVWTLSVPGSSLMHAGSRERLQAALAGLGHAVRLDVVQGAADDSPARRLAAAAAARLREAEATLRDDPFVQAMMRDFGGKIVSGSLQAL